LLDLNKRSHCKTGGCRCAVLQNFLRYRVTIVNFVKVIMSGLTSVTDGGAVSL